MQKFLGTKIFRFTVYTRYHMLMGVLLNSILNHLIAKAHLVILTAEVQIDQSLVGN